MIRPRFIAQFLAWLLGYFWLPCPVCKEYFAGFETDRGSGAVLVREEDGDHMYCVCSKSACVAEGRRQQMAYMQLCRGEEYETDL